jgi:hypothetical protein
VDQHTISGWLLRAFAKGSHLAAYAKGTGTYEDVDPEDFLIEIDAHSHSIEHGIGRIEGPAADAARNLAKWVRGQHLPAGLYAVSPTENASHFGPPGVKNMGVREGMRLFVGERDIPSPKPDERAALARYVGLMYQRAPRTEQAILAWGRAFDVAAQSVLDRLLPGFHTGLQTELSHRRRRMLEMASRIGDRLVGASWWLVVAGSGEAFILGDAPVAATISLGHDDEWRAILAAESYAVVMPLSPQIALLMAPQGLIPITGIDEDLSGLVIAINRLVWRRAGSYVLARERSHLQAVWPDAGASIADRSNDVAMDAKHGAEAGARVGLSIAVEVGFRQMQAQWQRWTGCTLVFGWYPWPREDHQKLRWTSDTNRATHPQPTTSRPLRPSRGRPGLANGSVARRQLR